jgi:hypothetical protein
MGYHEDSSLTYHDDDASFEKEDLALKKDRRVMTANLFFIVSICLLLVALVAVETAQLIGDHDGESRREVRLYILRIE